MCCLSASTITAAPAAPFAPACCYFHLPSAAVVSLCCAPLPCVPVVIFCIKLKALVPVAGCRWRRECPRQPPPVTSCLCDTVFHHQRGPRMIRSRWADVSHSGWRANPYIAINFSGLPDRQFGCSHRQGWAPNPGMQYYMQCQLWEWESLFIRACLSTHAGLHRGVSTDWVKQSQPGELHSYMFMDFLIFFFSLTGFLFIGLVFWMRAYLEWHIKCLNSKTEFN